MRIVSRVVERLKTSGKNEKKITLAENFRKIAAKLPP